MSTISKQVKGLREIADKYEQIGEGDYIRILQAADTIEALSAKVAAENVEQSDGGGWIPCSERFPNKEEYLKDSGRFILDDGNRRYQGLFDIYDGKFKFSKHISGIKYELFEDKCVIAWQPLPEPYSKNGGN